MGLKPQNLTMISPGHLAAYLSELGFRKEKPRGASDIWRFDDQPLIVPKERGAEDYVESVYDVLRKLSNFNRLSIAETFQEVINRAFDRFDIRVASTDSKSGQISFDFFPELVTRLKPMLRSAGWSVLRPRPMHTGAPPKEVDALLKQTKVGLTKMGSYIIPFYVPKDVVVDTQQISSFGFNSIEKLQTSVSILSKIEKDGRYDSDRVGELPISGVTTNICDAVVEILQAGVERHLNLGFSFRIGTFIPDPKDGSVHSQVRSKFVLDSEKCEVLEKLSSSLRNKVEESGFYAEGWVIGLERENQQDVGTVTLLTKIGSHGRKLRFRVTPTPYSKLVNAHKEGRRVGLSGTLKYSKGRYFLEDAHDIKLLDEIQVRRVNAIQGVLDLPEEIDPSLLDGLGLDESEEV